MVAAKKKILVVDDEPDVISFLSTLLEDNGYEVTTAMNGEEGFEKAKNEKPNLITLDITMPQESGVRMYKDLLKDSEIQNIPVIMVTGVSKDFKQFIYGRKNLKPPDAYFEKPIDKEKLLEKVAELA